VFGVASSPAPRSAALDLSLFDIGVSMIGFWQALLVDPAATKTLLMVILPLIFLRGRDVVPLLSSPDEVQLVSSPPRGRFPSLVLSDARMHVACDIDGPPPTSGMPMVDMSNSVDEWLG